MKKKVFFIFISFIMLFMLSSCEKPTESEFTLKQKEIYQLAVDTVGYTGTFEEWLDSILGEQGTPREDGKSVELILQDMILFKI